MFPVTAFATLGASKSLLWRRGTFCLAKFPGLGETTSISAPMDGNLWNLNECWMINPIHHCILHHWMEPFNLAFGGWIFWWVCHSTLAVGWKLLMWIILVMNLTHQCTSRWNLKYLYCLVLCNGFIDGLLLTKHHAIFASWSVFYLNPVAKS